MSKDDGGIFEVVQRQGYVFDEIKIYPILCKPKLMPLKSVTLQKLERMQREAQEKMLLLQQKQKQEQQGNKLKNDKEKNLGYTKEYEEQNKANEASNNVDVWKPENDNEEIDPV
uniref:BBSome-interacting protein 1 n=1 Tax=Romanomermis culicivorax TaxID=13658 RepID=A0A915KYP0_ROMCU